MRIAHVLTYVSADGAFGGPLAVLSEQTRELVSRGHDVEVYAGWDGRATLDLPGVDVRLFRARQLVPAGFSGLVAPGLRRALVGRLPQLDVVHVHLARDLVTTPAALAVLRKGSTSLFLQPHGMVKPDTRPRARVADLWVRRVLAGATGTFALTAVDSARLREVEAGTRVLDLPNGVTIPPEPERAPRDRPEVLFLARLHPRKRVLLFAEAARRLLAEGVVADFVVVGPDEGDLAELERLRTRWGLGERLRYEGPVQPGAGRARIAEADVYVLPSLNEPFPMSLLEALSVGTPSVTSATCHIADRLGDAVALFEEQADPADALSVEIRRLVVDEQARLALGRRGREAVRSSFSITRVGDLLERYYAERSRGEPPAIESTEPVR